MKKDHGHKSHLVCTRLFWPLGAILVAISNFGYAAGQDDAGQQALQQLKILQQRLSPASDKGGANNSQQGGQNQVASNGPTNNTLSSPSSMLSTVPAAAAQPATNSAGNQAPQGQNNSAGSAELAPIPDQELIDSSAFDGVLMI